MLLNKIEIGQFLNMKYKLKPEDIRVKNIKLYTTLVATNDCNANELTIKFNNSIASTKPKNIEGIKPLEGICFSVIKQPSLFLKLKSLIKRVLLVITSNKGKPSIVAQLTKEAAVTRSSEAKQFPRVNPALIQNQKTKFQNLSLVSQLGWFLQNVAKSSMAFSYNYWFQIYSIIISKYHHFSKQIKTLILVISLGLCGNNAFAMDLQVDRNIKQLIKNTEQQYSIPSGLLMAIATIESGMNAYAVNVNGKSVLASNSREASSFIANARSHGISNIDVGIMQLNYRWHASGFASMQEMLNPQKNIEYAASFLLRLKKQHGTWHKALRYYHSAKPEHHRKYSRKVVLCWLNE